MHNGIFPKKTNCVIPDSVSFTHLCARFLKLSREHFILSTIELRTDTSFVLYRFGTEPRHVIESQETVENDEFFVASQAS